MTFASRVGHERDGCRRADGLTAESRREEKSPPPLPEQLRRLLIRERGSLIDPVKARVRVRWRVRMSARVEVISTFSLG